MFYRREVMVICPERCLFLLNCCATFVSLKMLFHQCEYQAVFRVGHIKGIVQHFVICLFPLFSAVTFRSCFLLQMKKNCSEPLIASMRGVGAEAR